MQDLSLFERNFIVIATIVSFFVFTLILPIIDELCFRRYLLARMKWMGKSAVLLNVILFSLYQFWSPWLILTRIISMLPSYYFVYKKGFIKISHIGTLLV
ncbi:type II CAAX prenyl endopeptidase Rce1 family protein [Gracilibacillus saliphilus]|uniref:CPBP family glutamic-type intramembrane protease n=1 Tax=Gracilibacillus saliphilus TaxID=543890 RepID=UPI003B52C2C8